MKQYLLIGALIAILGVVVGAYLTGYKNGKRAEIAASAAQIEKERQRQQQLIEELEKTNAQQRVVVREKIKVIRQVKDTTGCLDAPLPAAFLEQLH